MSSDHAPLLRYTVSGGVATIEIDHPTRLNAMTFEMWQELPRRLDEAERDDAVRVVLLRGAGSKAFSSGSDISQFGERRSTEAGITLWNDTVQVAARRLAALRKPTIAWVQGMCFGGGVGLAVHCDLRYASADAVFSIPAAKLGVAYYPSWLKRLSALTGPAHAKEIMYTARRYDAEQAAQIGLVNAVCDAERVADVTQRMAGAAPLSLGASKLAIDEAIEPGRHGLQACEDALRACFASQDYTEGQAAFREKRTPAFSGR